MSATSRRVPGGVFWMHAEPGRLRRDQEEISAFAPGLKYVPPPDVDDAVLHHGGWVGVLPLWPFNRPEPAGLHGVTRGLGLACEMWCSSAHPMVAPAIYPHDPEPEIAERTYGRWHVAPGGSLCLLQSDGAWSPESSIIELLLKAAGWRIEYALMKAGVIEKMSINGIVSDPSGDHLIAEAATACQKQEAR